MGSIGHLITIGAGVASSALGAEAACSQLASMAPCQLVIAGVPTAGVSQVYADCGSSSLRLGEATSYASAANVAAGLLLVVRQDGLGTEVDLVKQAPDGSAQLDELSGELRQKLAEVGAGRPASFAVDLSGFATTGVVAVAGSTGSGKFQLNLSDRGLLAATG